MKLCDTIFLFLVITTLQKVVARYEKVTSENTTANAVKYDSQKKFTELLKNRLPVPAAIPRNFIIVCRLRKIVVCNLFLLVV
mmetsp:Transcript_19502/g.40126  ORF Transcript_19502/g.40126 Transcript_19502/m.40126 type:complete len:82 (+) Transcript_19502:2568-2813(+)